MIAQIIPQIRLPRKIKYLDYLVPPGILVSQGQLVKIPFRKRVVVGLVSKLTEQTTQKNLKSIESTTPWFLPKTLRQIIFTMAEEFLVSPAVILETVLPEIPKKITPEKSSHPVKFNEPVKIQAQDLSKWQKIITRLRQPEANPLLYHYHFPLERTVLVYKLIEAGLREGKKIILICPEIREVIYWQQLMAKLTIPAVFHSDLNKSQLWLNWRSVNEGTASLVIGTRQAIFTPLAKVDLIILNEPENDNLKQADQNPRYDCRTLVKERTRLDRAQSYWFSQTPRVVDYYEFKNLTSEFGHSLPKTTIADSKKTPRKTFDLNLKDKIDIYLVNQKKILFLINRRGWSGAVICDDCHQLLSCSKCRLKLTRHQNFLKCHGCNQIQDLPPLCPGCSSPNLISIGTGSQQLENLLRRDFPGVTIDRFDTDKPTVASAAQIIIATPLIFGRFIDHLKNLGLIVVYSIDNLLEMADFSGGEKFYRLINHLLHYAQERQVEIYFQTHQPDNPAIVWGLSDNYIKFYKSEIESRQKFSYPPFGQLKKLILRAKSSSELELKTNILRTALTKGVSLNVLLNPKVSGPRHRIELILKYPNDQSENVNKILRQSTEEFLIDPEPISLI